MSYIVLSSLYVLIPILLSPLKTSQMVKKYVLIFRYYFFTFETCKGCRRLNESKTKVMSSAKL